MLPLERLEILKDVKIGDYPSVMIRNKIKVQDLDSETLISIYESDKITAWFYSLVASEIKSRLS